ncbi:tyrosine-type recombinase/integrase [Desulfonatronum thioautotrophicum]|uniref:tyrosine-type recombinase/integrase n=1 Tax=Desulfonatronum thioautotrophicum TaxID=617001 RepID=UPI0005EB9873|nr:tyrosine-type recombinase/integrase [Desulfonatronum thioautotrophicum]
MALSDKGIRTLVPQEKAYTKYDSDGLFIQVTPSGGKLWRMKFMFNGKQQVIALGQFPDVGITAARKMRTEAKAEIQKGINPALERKKKREVVRAEQVEIGTTFEKVAREWWEKSKAKWSEDHAALVWRRLELNVLPYIGRRPISHIEPADLLEQLERIEVRGAVETARRVYQILGQVFRFGVAKRYCQRNQAADLSDALAKPVSRSMPAILEPDKIRGLLLAMDEYQGSPVVRAGMQFLSLTFQRPGEVRHAEWSEIDFENATWSIPESKMKMKKAHIVPLSRQALQVLVDLHPLTGHAKYVFPSERSDQRPMSENTINAALRRMGYTKDEMVGHGWRSIASTKLHESGLFDSRVIEVAMAHVDQNTVRGVYNRALYLDERGKLFQYWGDYLDSLRSAGKVIPFGKVANG